MPEKPHVVLITMDELHKEALSCCGARAIQTPNLDRLAASSLSFGRAHTASPLCLPSRATLATGLWPHNHGAVSNHPPSALRPELPNLYTCLRAAGYVTAHVGKCHYLPVPYGETRPDVTLPYEAFREYYLSLGIDHLDLQDDKQVSVWFYDDYSRELDAAGHLAAYRDAMWNRTWRKVFPFPGPAEWHPDAWVGRKAVAYLEGCDGARPTFLWVSFSGPHYPFDPPAAYLERVDVDRVGVGHSREGEFDDDKKIHHRSFHGPGLIDGAGQAPERACKNFTEAYWRRLRQHYLANVAQLDDEVGRILHAVERALGQDVLIVFTCDHGEMMGNHRLWGKHACGYEDVMRVPMFVRLPGQAVGQVSDALVSLVDVMPTVLAVAGVEGPPMDGRDLRTSVADGGYPVVFSEANGFLAATDGRHKYVHFSRGGKTLSELYDLEADPHEFENRVHDPDHAPALADMRGAVVEHLLRDGLPNG
jgi:arylsulfatase A-like enzyme